MKLFLSWSGKASHEIALAFKEWIPSVIQLADPYVSSEDINKGSRWSTDIASELETSTVGIIFVTPENLEAPWIHFEAGALSKVIDKSRVCPFLLGVKRKDIKGPLVQFQSTIYEKDDVKKLLLTINSVLEDKALPEERFKKSFDMWWPILSEKLDIINDKLQKEDNSKNKEKDEDIDKTETLGILEEILELARNQQRIITSPDEILPPNYLNYVLRKHTNTLNPSAIEDLRRCLNYAEDVLDEYSKHDEDYIPIEELKKLVEDLRKPIKYIFRKYRPSRQVFLEDEVAISKEW